MHNIIFGIFLLSNLLLSPVIFAEDNEEEQFNISSMLKDLRSETNENQDYVPDDIKELRKEIDDYPLSIERSWLKSFYCRDYPDLVEEGVCFCGTEDLLYAEQLVLEKNLISQFFNCFSVPAGAVVEDWMKIKVSAEYNKDGTIKSDTVKLLNTNIKKTHPFYDALVEATLYSMCKTIDLPLEEYHLWGKVIVNFDFSLSD